MDLSDICTKMVSTPTGDLVPCGGEIHDIVVKDHGRVFVERFCLNSRRCPHMHPLVVDEGGKFLPADVREVFDHVGDKKH